MNRTQFWILIAGSALLVVFLLLQIIFSRSYQFEQGRALAAQQIVTEGRAAYSRWRQLAGRVYQVANQNQDQGLKDLLTRQQITVTNAPSATPPESNSSSGR